jgi:hypothetical protein
MAGGRPAMNEELVRLPSFVAGLGPAIHESPELIVEIIPMRILSEDQPDFQDRRQCFIFLSRCLAKRMSS